jgi:hypothetical protein
MPSDALSGSERLFKDLVTLPSQFFGRLGMILYNSTGLCRIGNPMRLGRGFDGGLQLLHAS